MSFLSFIKRKIFRDSRERWNYQFQKGRWDGLGNDSELIRQKVVKSYFNKYKEGGSLLELGCGQGHLVDAVFEKKHFSSYLGVDLSDVAIDAAQKRVGAKNIRFEQGDMNALAIKDRFDVVLFNESINYAKDCHKVLADAIKNLSAKDGIFIVSMHEHKRSPEIWKAVDDLFTILDQQVVEKGEHKWRVKVLKSKN